MDHNSCAMAMTLAVILHRKRPVNIQTCRNGLETWMERTLDEVRREPGIDERVRGHT